MNAKNISVLLAGMLTGFALAVSWSSFSEEKVNLGSGMTLDLEAARCVHGIARDGTFYQSMRDTNNSLSTNCFSIGVSQKLYDRVGWRIAYHNFGTIRARDNKVTQRDEDAFRYPLPPCDPRTTEGCTGTMSGEGETRGISISATYDIPLAHGFRIITEGGLLFFSHKFNSWAWNDDSGKLFYINERSRFTDAPAPILGLGIQWQHFYLMARKVIEVGHRAQSLTDQSLDQLALGVRIPL